VSERIGGADTKAAPWSLSECRRRIGLERHVSVLPFDPDSPASRSVATRQWIAADVVHVVTTPCGRADRGLDRFDLLDVDDGLLSVAADAVHGARLKGKAAVRWSVAG